MNTSVSTISSPALSASQGSWRALYWEPVMATGERFCFAIAYEWLGIRRVESILRPGILQAMYGSGGDRAEKLLDRIVRLCNAHVRDNDIESLPGILASMTGIYSGAGETAHVNDVSALLQVAKLMSSSLASLGEIDDDALETAEPDRLIASPNKQFATRVRDLVISKRIELTPYFNKEATLMTTKRSVRFGFLSTSYAAHFGLLQPTGLPKQVRNSRGLIAELSIAAKQSGRKCTLFLGYPPLKSANLMDKERVAIQDYIEELGLEAKEFSVDFKAADNDQKVSEELLAEAST